MTELELHKQVAQFLSWAAKDVLYTHLPMGEYRHKATAGKLKGMGVAKGWPDFLFVLDGGQAACIELKRPKPNKTYQSPEQKEFQRQIKAKGGLYRVCRSLEEVQGTLRGWGVFKDRAA